MIRSVRTRVTVALCACAVASTVLAAPLGTGFTYQGRLNQNGSPLNGVKTLRLSLWDAQSTTPGVGGNQLGSRQLMPNILIENGAFAVVLNAENEFGPNAFNGDARFLQVEICEDIACGALTVLSPRQEFTATPYALQTRGIFVNDAGNVGIGTNAPTAPLEVHGPMVIVSQGDQADVLWLGIERSWLFRQEGTGAGTALKLESVGGGGNKNFFIQTTGGVGIGTAIPNAKLDVRGDIRLGASGQLSATAGEENLRIIRGTINANGSASAGSGFQSNRASLGSYNITFNTPFSGLPSVTTGGECSGIPVILIQELTASNCKICTLDNSSTVVFKDARFHFIAVGPR